MDIFDFVVIGSGPAGRRAAVQAAKIGGKVLVVESGRKLGGVSVHTGTIPSKTLRETVLNLSGWRERGFYGEHYRVKSEITAGDLMARMHQTLEHEAAVLENQFIRNGIRHVRAEASFLSPNRLMLKTEEREPTEVSFVKCLIATGTRPTRPPSVPFDHTHVFDSDGIIAIKAVPRSLIIIGAGVIGVEYASIFSALDVPVTLVDPRPTILDFLDRELTGEFLHHLKDRGVVTRFGCPVLTISKTSDCVDVTLANGSTLRSHVLFHAIGRVGNVEGLNLQCLGIVADARGKITVNQSSMQTAVSHIYAAGDIIGFPSLASTSMEQGRIAACHAFGIPLPPKPEAFPYGIYAVPEISTVGQSEEEVRVSGIAYECGVARFRETSRGQIMGSHSGFLKLVFSVGTGRLLGAHIVGEGATELIHIGQAVINLGGTIDYFVNNIFNYPTLAEAYKIAGLDAWNRMSKNRRASHVEVLSA
jgi:NAD(P) transhydrogenase